MLLHDYVPSQLWKDRIAEQERKAELEAVKAERKNPKERSSKKERSKTEGSFLQRIGFI